MFVALVIQKSLGNNFRGGLSKQECKGKVSGNKHRYQFSFCTKQFLHISQSNIQHQKQYILIVTAVKVLRVGTIKFHQLKIIIIA
jgi:hypothetical protein